MTDSTKHSGGLKPEATKPITKTSLRNLRAYIRTTERQYENAVKYADMLKRDIARSKRRLAQRLSKTQKLGQG